MTMRPYITSFGSNTSRTTPTIGTAIHSLQARSPSLGRLNSNICGSGSQGQMENTSLSAKPPHLTTPGWLVLSRVRYEAYINFYLHIQRIGKKLRTHSLPMLIKIPMASVIRTRCPRDPLVLFPKNLIVPDTRTIPSSKICTRGVAQSLNLLGMDVPLSTPYLQKLTSS